LLFSGSNPMNKKNLILAAILVVLVAAAYLYRGPVGEWLEERGQPDNFLAQVKPSEVQRIDVAEQTGTTTLVRADGKWKIQGTKDFYVKDSVAQTMEAALSDAKTAEPEVASTRADKKGEFQTDTATGVRVRLHQSGEVAADFVVGKLAGDFTSTFVSRPGIDKTYKLSADLNRAFTRAEWYDKTVFSSKNASADRVRFQYPASEFAVEKEGEGDEATWVGVEPYRFRVNDGNVSEIVDLMTNLTAAEIPEQTFEGTGLADHEIIVQVTGEGLDHTLMVGDARDGEAEEPLYYAKKGASDNIYLITQEQKNTLDTSIRGLQ